MSTGALAASTSSGHGRRRGWPRRLSRKRCERDRPDVLADELPVPPAPRLAAFVGRREPVAVISRAQKSRRPAGKWIRFQQRQRRGIAAQQLLEQRDAPF